MRPSTLKKFLRQPNFDEHLALHKLDCMASHRDLSALKFCTEELAKQPPEKLRPEPLISGVDLINMGLKPGPEFKKILSEVEDRQLEGALSTRDEALVYIKSLISAG
jgi:poly(A) polymerase